MRTIENSVTDLSKLSQPMREKAHSVRILSVAERQVQGSCELLDARLRTRIAG